MLQRPSWPQGHQRVQQRVQVEPWRQVGHVRGAQHRNHRRRQHWQQALPEVQLVTRKNTIHSVSKGRQRRGWGRVGGGGENLHCMLTGARCRGRLGSNPGCGWPLDACTATSAGTTRRRSRGSYPANMRMQMANTKGYWVERKGGRL